ncbi:MAG: tetratricopeptide repeat protein, partial [Kofleriaceae bacterium]
MRRVIAMGVAVVFLGGTPAVADLTTGRDKLVAGDYKTAIAELTKVTGKDRPTARTMAARAQIVLGDHAGAEATLVPLAATKDAQGAEARILLAELRQLSGRIGEARKDLEALYKERPDDRAVRTALGVVRYKQGAIVDAKLLFDKTIKEEDDNKLNYDDPVQMHQLAEAARYTGSYKLANDAYREALKLRPQLTDAGVEGADLFMQNYAPPHAEQTHHEVFKIN